MLVAADIILGKAVKRERPCSKNKQIHNIQIGFSICAYPVNFKMLHWSLEYDSSTLEQTDKQRDHRVDESKIC